MCVLGERACVILAACDVHDMERVFQEYISLHYISVKENQSNMGDLGMEKDTFLYYRNVTCKEKSPSRLYGSNRHMPAPRAGPCLCPRSIAEYDYADANGGFLHVPA